MSLSADRFGSLVMGAQAAGAEIEPGGFAIDFDSHRVRIGVRTLIGMAFRMANVMTELWRFAADITLQFYFLLTVNSNLK